MCKTRSPIMLVVILYILMMFCDISTTQTEEFPREFDFRYTSYQELESSFNIFQHAGIVGYYVQQTVDISRNQLLVGAREWLYRLSLDNLTSLEVIEWPSENITKRTCKSKGQEEVDCHNFVRVLLVHEDAVFTCGTNAFSPVCTWRSADNLTDIRETRPGIAYCAYSPDHNSTAVMTTDGNYYSGTVSDITGRDPAIYRLQGSQAMLGPMLRTVKLNSKWLNEPDFVSAYEIEDFVYFFFREVAVEYINCGKRVFSRVARVCKNDKGGNFVLEDNWTTFFKARMNCSLPGEFPFYFDELQSTFLLETPTEKLLYAIFTTPVNSLEGSAVCVFNMSSLNSTFTGPYKYQENARSAWERHDNTDPISQCPVAASINKRELEETEMKKQAQQTLNAQKYQLMDKAVQPENIMPTLVGKNERWTHVVVDYVEGKGGIYKVIFITTAKGYVRKMVQLLDQSDTCLVEEIDVVPNGDHKPVKQLQLAREKGSLYISTLNKIIQVPVQTCNRFKDSDLCLNSMDPYCGWNQNTGECTVAPEGMPTLHYWIQSMASCPIVQHPVDGGWSNWTAWLPCQQTGNDPSYTGQCLCHMRSCNNPKALYGGADCTGSSIEVTNCTVHGQWTEWSEWSSCSSSCGEGTRTRRRHCSDPPPRFGGDNCVGHDRGYDREEGYCPGNPSCPDPPVDGNWTPWSDWGQCTAECNGGIQMRRRLCSKPPPSQDGVPCIGNKQEWRMCNTHSCQEKQRMTPWSPWIKTNTTEDGYFQQRYRFMCRANVADENMIKSSHVKSIVRYCFNKDDSCHRPELAINITTNGNWSDWSAWSKCTKDCDAGIQWRRRSCNNPPPTGLGRACTGHSVEAKECNTHSCQGKWGCWTEYTQCSVSCGQGTQIRLRRCRSALPGSQYKIPCAGHEEEKKDCYISTCNDVVVQSLSSIKERQFSLFHLIIVGSGTFVVGISFSLGIYICVKSLQKFQNSDTQRERQIRMERKSAIYTSQMNIDFLHVNNKIYDSTILYNERNMKTSQE